MSFSVQVTPDLVPLEPGATTPVSIVVVNKGTEADRYELEIEGIDPEWKAIRVPVFGADAGETHTEKVFLKPQRASESLAGNYPFVVRVRSLISGEQRTVQGVAQVRPFHNLSMEIDPKKGFVSPTRRQNAFDVTLVNLGNTEHTVQLLASDPEDACAYEFDQETVTLGPGQQRDVEMVVNPTSSPIFSSGRLIGFTVTGRSADTPSVGASAQAQLEQRPLLTPTSLAVVLLIGLLLAAWLVMMPKPPTASLDVNPGQTLVGQPVRVTWSTEHAKRIVITAGEEQIYDGSDPRGERQWTPSADGTVTLHLTAISGDMKKDETKQVTVKKPEPVPAPRILSLNAAPTHVRLGEPFLMKYRLSDSVTEALLEPTGEVIDRALEQIEITTKRAGDIEYTLVAKNAAGDVVRRSFHINVVDESDAQILGFAAAPMRVDPADGHVTLNWQVTNAERVELVAGSGEPTVVPPSGNQTFSVVAKTRFTLTAIDSKNRRTNKSVVVTVEAPPAPAPPRETTGGGATGTTDATTGTTGGSGGTTTTGATTGVVTTTSTGTTTGGRP